jgi:nitroimidazol reductase NimA-like FMN-containing flavoprotein (pyridoxamine 5'-phosphate oxidase superfamily)
MSTHWPDSVDQILDGDHVVMLSYVTPASGVVLLPVTNFGVRDRAAGTVTVNSSVGAWRKLDRMRRNPHVAVAFHTREHALHARPEYVLVQGRARLSEPIPDYPNTILDHWERMEPWRETNRFWRWWQKVYALRVAIEISVDRIVVWPDLSCAGWPDVFGARPPSGPPRGQQPPTGGTVPRINHARAARRAARLPNRLLGWVDADGFPFLVPAQVAGTEERGIVLDVPARLVPPGGRRAGLTAHWFSRGVIGQNQRKHTGWMEVEPGARQVLYAPHTQSNYRFPTSRMLYRLVSGGGTRWWVRRARRAGIAP